MGNMLIAMLFLAFSFVSFRYSYGFMGAYRTFYGLFTHELDICVVNLTSKGESTIPYFSLEKVKSFAETYLSERLAHTCDYEFEVEGFEFRDDYGLYPMGVSINLRCYLISKTLLDKTAYFTLVEESE